MKVMNVVLPFRGEFGLKLWWHVPAVHAIEPDVCYIEAGEQALYPSAREWTEVDRQHDDRRRNNYAKDDGTPVFEAVARWRFPAAELLKPSDRWPRKRFVPQPHWPQGVSCDVVVCPRWRNYGAEKNWPHWVDLTARLNAEGLNVFAGGAADSSQEVPAVRAWEFERNLDATIEAMHSARLVVATDAGLAHLAVLCGRPLLMITHADGLVAPGSVNDEHGRPMEPQYWPVKMHRYHEANHTGSPIELVKHAWDDPARVFARTMEILAVEEAA
jgi:ADP-heptose:LPS heptosyltransferase